MMRCKSAWSRRAQRCGAWRAGSPERRRDRLGQWPVVLAAVVVAVLSTLAGEVTSAFAAGRVALVIGNSAYAHMSPLPNPVNDAADIGAVLRRLGFEVTIERDAGKAGLENALAEFSDRSIGADVSLIFYAGHGMEMDGVNYLVPVDARLARDTRVRFETVVLDDVLAATEGAGLRLVVLDACRNNPLAQQMTRSVRSRSVSRGSFGDIDDSLLGDETLVAYAAAAGTTADDGEGRNSPYTAALLAHLEQPLDVLRLFQRVRAQVVRATNGRQRPHEYQSLLGEHYLSSAVGTPAPVAVESALGLDRSARRAIQRGLASAGFSPGGADGVFGPATRAAIRGWQASRGLAATGYLDASAAAALRPVVGGGGMEASRQQETVFWQSIQSNPTAAAYEAYLSQYPNGAFAALARLRAAELRGGAADPPRSDPVPVGLRVGEVFRDCAACPEMVVVPSGTFTMGSPASEEGRDSDEGPQHRVTIPVPFAVGVYEVTFAEWDACVSAGGCLGHPPAERGRGGSSPVIYVSWTHAQAYVRWLSTRTGESYRLLSESEWEYVARAGTTTAYWWGASIGQGRANCRGCGSRWGGPAPVDMYRPNGFGLHDVSGNVWEWVEDCYRDNYRGAPTDGSAWTSGGDCGRRVARGGSWLDDAPRSAARGRAPAAHRDGTLGFRVSRTLD